MSIQTETVNIRQATEDDQQFINQMCYEAGFPDGMDDRLTFEAAQQIDWVPLYQEEWGKREGDFGLIAEKDGKPLGAAWYRDYSALITNENTPKHELSIALLPEARGHKIGSELMTKLLEGASEQGIEDISLVVRESNAVAKNMYQKIGFLTIHESDDGYITMAASTSSADPK